MKKLLLLLLTFVLCLSSVSLFACGKKETEKDEDIVAIYDTYVVFSEKNGTTPLSYENWLESIKGKDGAKGDKGVGIKNAYINEDGDLIVELTDGSAPINAGNIVSNENPQGLDFYMLPDGTYAVGAGNAKYLKEIEIPATYKGKPVTTIQVFGNESDDAFMNCHDLREITLPNSITTIEQRSFYSCENLASITIPASVTRMGKYVFESSNLKVIYCEAKEKPEGWHKEWCLGEFDIVWDCKNNDVSENGYQYVKKDGNLYKIKDGEASLIFVDRKLKEVVVPESISYNGVKYDVVSMGEDIIGWVDGAAVSPALEKITIGKNVKKIERITYELDNLKEIVYEGTTEEWGLIELSSNWLGWNESIIHVQCSDGQVPIE